MNIKRMLSAMTVAAMLVSTISVPTVAEGEKWTAETTKDKWVKITQEGGETLGYSEKSGVTILTVDGYAFKDLNKNGELDPYEDWRLSDQARAEDLAARLSIEQISGLRYENGLVMMDVDNARSIIEDDLCTNIFGNNLTSSDVELAADYVNDVQVVAESQPLGIPVQFIVDPRDFFYQGINQLSLGATFDTELAKEIYTEAAKIYRSLGITLLYGPQADTASEPRWKRASNTFGEDPQLNADMANATISGLQSTFSEDGTDESWGMDSVVSEVKHYPGDGAAESGRESHAFYGKYNVYPGDNFEASLVPFNDGAFDLDSATDAAAAVMMSYSIAWSEDEEYGDLVGSAFSTYKIGLLRDNGFDGVISTDALIDGDNNVGVTESIHGMEGYDYAEQIYEIIAAGVDRILTPNFAPTPAGGTGMSPENISIPQYIAMAYETMVEEQGKEAAEENYRSSATRILVNYFRTGIFENPYIDEKNAKEVINAAKANLVNENAQKTIAMLKNSGNIIAERSDKPTVYVPMVESVTDKGDETVTTYVLPVDEASLNEYFTLVTDTVTEEGLVRADAGTLANCELAVTFISNPATGTGYDASTETYIPISLQYSEYTADGDNVREESLSRGVIENVVSSPYGDVIEKVKDDRAYYGESTVATNLSDMQMVLDTKANLPENCKLVVCVTASNAMVFSEIEPSADAILVSFGVDAQNFLPLIAGKVEPTALLPIQMPANMDTVEMQYEDVSRDMECYVDADGNTYDFAFGMNWSGVINDARVAKYSVEVKNVPENYNLSTNK